MSTLCPYIILDPILTLSEVHNCIGMTPTSFPNLPVAFRLIVHWTDSKYVQKKILLFPIEATPSSWWSEPSLKWPFVEVRLYLIFSVISWRDIAVNQFGIAGVGENWCNISNTPHVASFDVLLTNGSVGSFPVQLIVVLYIWAVNVLLHTHGLTAEQYYICGNIKSIDYSKILLHWWLRRNIIDRSEVL